jgi:hypothetical protein
MAGIRRTARAFKAGNKSALAIAGYLLLILPLVLAQGTGEFIGYQQRAGHKSRAPGVIVRKA